MTSLLFASGRKRKIPKKARRNGAEKPQTRRKKARLGHAKERNERKTLSGKHDRFPSNALRSFSLDPPPPLPSIDVRSIERRKNQTRKEKHREFSVHFPPVKQTRRDTKRRKRRGFPKWLETRETARTDKKKNGEFSSVGEKRRSRAAVLSNERRKKRRLPCLQERRTSDERGEAE